MRCKRQRVVLIKLPVTLIVQQTLMESDISVLNIGARAITSLKLSINSMTISVWKSVDGVKTIRGRKHQEKLERAKGIEPSYRAWEALVLPLNYARFEVRMAL